jgi:hypothetical protein
VFRKIRLYQGIDLLGSVSHFKIVPDTNGKRGGVDWMVNGLLSDFGVIGEIEGPHFCTVLTVEDKGIVSLP